MRGALYAATEIVVFLLIATLIGIVIGRLWAAAGRSGTAAEPAPAEPPEERLAPAAKGGAASAELAEANAKLAAAEAEREELRKQLSVAEWQVSTLQEELAAQPED